MKDVRGQTVILTGASRGIGAHLAKALAMHGANLALAARDASKLEGVRAECESIGVKAIAVRCDVTSPDDQRNLVETAERQLGPVGVLINNAGIERVNAVKDFTMQDIDDILLTNLHAPIQMIKLVLPGMLQRRRGSIVTISSMAGKAVAPYNAIYSASKAGINAFTQSMNVELAGSGVTASVVCPAFVGETGMWADRGGKAPRLMREVSPEKVIAGTFKAIAGAPEILITPGPIRPLLAFMQVAPSLTTPIVKFLKTDTAMRDAGQAQTAHTNNAPSNGATTNEPEREEAAAGRE